mmetsp:Transcript_19723/g.36381  ORF Transcript_19723/g.36381 Transcript_19723/m.36381 type:complete len:388 (-) Transcript_19723:2578-3741(-)
MEVYAVVRRRLQRGDYLAEICSNYNFSKEAALAAIVDHCSISIGKASNILKMSQRGYTAKKIKAKTKANFEVLSNLLPHVDEEDRVVITQLIKEGKTPAEIAEALDFNLRLIEAEASKVNSSDGPPAVAESEAPAAEPSFGEDIKIYSYDSNILHLTSLTTRRSACYTLHSFRTRLNCAWTLVPSHCLIFTGGNANYDREVDVIYLKRDYAATSLSKMRYGRREHSAVHDDGYLYVVGGYGGMGFPHGKCERYSIKEDSWEKLPSLHEVVHPGLFVVSKGLFVVGGSAKSKFKNMMRLDLERLVWDVVYVKLPDMMRHVDCFTLHENSSHIYLISDCRIYVYKAELQTINLVKPIEDYYIYKGGPLIYHKGILYISQSSGPARMLAI